GALESAERLAQPGPIGDQGRRRAQGRREGPRPGEEDLHPGAVAGWLRHPRGAHSRAQGRWEEDVLCAARLSRLDPRLRGPEIDLVVISAGPAEGAWGGPPCRDEPQRSCAPACPAVAVVTHLARALLTGLREVVGPG